MRKFLLVLGNPFVMSALITVGIGVLFPFNIQRFSFEHLDSQILEADYRLIYHDLDGDGVSEQLTFKHDLHNQAAVVVRNLQGGVIGQWNFEGVLAKTDKTVTFCDFFSDGFQELALLTLKDNYLLLNIIEPLGTSGYQKAFIVDSFNMAKGYGDLIPQFCLTNDLDGDGSQELIMRLYAGFTLSPRKVYVFDPKNDTLWASCDLGTNVHISDAMDIDGDGYAELFAITNAPGNYSDSVNVVLHDSTSYILVFDHLLNFKFPPIPVGGVFSTTFNYPILAENQWVVLSVTYFRSITNDYKLLSVHDVHGSKWVNSEHSVPDRSLSSYLVKPGLLDNYQHFSMLASDGSLVTFDASLTVTQTLQLASEGLKDLIPVYTDGNVQTGFIGFSHDYASLWYFGGTIKKIHCRQAVPIAFQPKYVHHSLIYEGDGLFTVFLQTDHTGHYFRLKKYAWYPWSYLLYPGLFFAVLGVILIAQYGMRQRLKKQYELSQQLLALELQVLRSQISPHFIFNILNSIGSHIMQEQKEQAYRMLSGFSSLIRKTIGSSNNLLVSVDEEVDFVRHYLSLQSDRLNGKIAFDITVQAHLPRDLLIPKMIIQIHVENAIKHGLSPKQGKGRVKVDVFDAGTTLCIEIQDDGIGRAAASHLHTKSTGQGMAILQQIYDVVERVHGLKVKQIIQDLLTPDGQASGTLVRIFIEKVG